MANEIKPEWDDTERDGTETSALPSHYSRAPGGGLLIPLHLRWGDMDINRHVNNVQFARLLEEARVRAFAAWFGSRQRLPVLVVRQDIEFRAPLEYSIEPITMTLAVSRVGRTSFTMGATLTDPDAKDCAVASTTLVAVAPDTGRPTEIPEDVRTVLIDWQGPAPTFHGNS